MTGQVPAGQLGQSRIPVHRGGRRAKPVTDQHVGVVRADHRPAHDAAAPRSEQQDVYQRLAFGADAGGGDPLAQLCPGQRPVRREGRLDHRDGLVGVAWRHALLRQPARARGGQLRGGQGVQPPVVLGADEMQRAAVQPGDQQGPLIRQRAVHVRRRQPGRPGPDGKPHPAGVLTLHCQQPLDDSRHAPGRLAGQQLGREPLGHDVLTQRGQHAMATLGGRTGMTPLAGRHALALFASVG